MFLSLTALLQRMDDPSGTIRILAASVIPYLCPDFNDQDEENSKQDEKVWENFMKHCMDILYLHYDGPDKNLQIAIKGNLKNFLKINFYFLRD